MIIWILESESGTKLLYKSFLNTEADEDIVSGFLTAFHHFSIVEFQQSLESIEMGGLRWIYILEPKYNLLFVAADEKNIKTEILMGRLNVIKEAFIKEFGSIWKKKGNWDGNVNKFLPFINTIEDYNHQWEQVEIITPVADFFDILGIFQHILISLNNIIQNKMYSKSRNLILNRIEKFYNELKSKKEFHNQTDLLNNISFSKEEWFNLIDINLIKCDMETVLKFINSLLTEIVNVLKEEKGSTLCFKYFSEERILAYTINNLKLLRDLDLDIFLLRLFLLL